MKFVPRLTAPTRTDKNYIHYSKGGYNTCIEIDKNTGYVLPNCVGYAQGRLLELAGATKLDWSLPACNAEDWFDMAKSNGMAIGNTPKLGSAIVWKAGKTHNAKDGAGHVGIVEHIYPNGDILISQSAFNGEAFFLTTLTKESGYLYSNERPLLGFVYSGIDFETGDSNTDITDNNEVKGWYVQVGYFENYDNVLKMSERLKADGYDVYIKQKE